MSKPDAIPSSEITPSSDYFNRRTFLRGGLALASLTATLTNTATSQGIAGKTVSFTLDGVAAGTAVTNSSGVATLSGVATTDSAGTHVGAVVANFAGDANDLSSQGTGDLMVLLPPG